MRAIAIDKPHLHRLNGHWRCAYQRWHACGETVQEAWTYYRQMCDHAGHERSRYNAYQREYMRRRRSGLS